MRGSISRILLNSLLFLIAFSFVSCVYPFGKVSRHMISKTSFVMDTFLQVELSDQYYTDELYQALQRIVTNVDKKVNSYTIGSDLYRVNQNAGYVPVEVDSETFFLVQKGIEFGEDSEGLFDITFPPLLEVYGFYRDVYQIPSLSELNQALDHVGYYKILMNSANQTIYLPDKKMKIDMSGYIKGYVLDKLSDYLVQNGVKEYSLNFGGNLSVCSLKEVTVGIENKTQRPISQSLTTKQSFISTSSGTHQFFLKDGQTYTHIVNPLSGSAIPILSSATVKTWSGLESDFLSTYFFLCGLEPSSNVIGKYLAQSSVYLFDLTDTFIVYAENNDS